VAVESRGKHLGRRVWWVRWWAIGGAVALVCGVTAGALVATNRGPSAAQVAGTKSKVVQAQQHAATEQAIAQRAAQVQLAAAVSVSPPSGTAGVALDAPVTVSTSVGALTAVQVTDAAGKPVTGVLAASKALWRSNTPLLATSTYRVVASVIDSNGLTAQRATTFSTLTPTAMVTGTVFPFDGMTVGVGQPIVVTFDHFVDTPAAQAAVLSHISVSMSKPVPGWWHWFSADELHFRPTAYWPAGEHVAVKADLDGWNATNGRWGTGQLNDSFSIGDAHVSVANLSTEEMTVTLNGATIATYPISGGRQQFPTMDGTHVVLDRASVVHMVSSTVGIPVHSPDGYDELVYNDVHISDSGEYVHAAPWSVGAQGRLNVSHGCINMSDANSLAFFNFSRVGDVIQVVGGSRPPAAGDHGVMDWSSTGIQWSPAVVHPLT
jgi:lipoprotein-anchoring transpeptidase ErfK/SrfK